MPWPDDVKEALRQFKLPQAQRTPGAPLLSMPAAELFTILAVAAAAPVWTHCPGVDVLKKRVTSRALAHYCPGVDARVCLPRAFP